MANPSQNSEMMRQITVEVKQGSPVVLPHNNVDQFLMNKLFPHKRKPVPQTSTVKRRKVEDSPPIDLNLMKVLGLNAPRADEQVNSTSSGTPSPPYVHTVPQIQGNVEKSPIDRRQPIRDQQADHEEDLRKLRRLALEVQIEKDRILTRYYSRKLELMDRQKHN